MSDTIRLYSFDYCDSSLGVWNRAWFRTRKEATADRQQMIDGYGYSPGEIGEYHDITEVCGYNVELTARGVLKALQDADPNT